MAAAVVMVGNAPVKTVVALTADAPLEAAAVVKVGAQSTVVAAVAKVDARSMVGVAVTKVSAPSTVGVAVTADVSLSLATRKTL